MARALYNEMEILGRIQAYLGPTGIEGWVEPNKIKFKDLGLYERQGLYNRTYLVRAECDGCHIGLILKIWDGKAQVVRKEIKILRFLGAMNLAVPKIYFYEPTGKVLGGPFVLMEWIRGTDPKDEYEVVDAAARSLVEIHRLGRGDLKGIVQFGGDYPQRELHRLKTQLIILLLSTLRRSALYCTYWTFVNELERRSAEGRSRLIHGDYGPHNVIFQNGRAYVLDWEGAEIGEPTFDVAYVCNALDYYDHLGGRNEGKRSDRFLKAYEKYGGMTRDLSFYRRLAALKLLIWIDSITYPNLFSAIAGDFIRLSHNKERIRLLRLRSFLLSLLNLREI